MLDKKRNTTALDWKALMEVKKGCLSELILSQSPHKSWVQRELNTDFWQGNDNNQSIYFYLLVCRLFFCARMACIKGAEPSTAPVPAFLIAFLCAAHYRPCHFTIRQTTHCFLCLIHSGWVYIVLHALARPTRLDSIFPQ